LRIFGRAGARAYGLDPSAAGIRNASHNLTSNRENRTSLVRFGNRRAASNIGQTA
jgi:hypothetical protein